ncbi:MAG: hypothetical protein LBH79_01465 [Nitrososphaerota archaeon]|jgi:uncharacterized membrane protein (DUF485 family)|nr:hypothetical protein [Nitrososphaerota archaeon]
MFNQKLNKTLNLNTCTNNNPKTHLRKLKRKKTFFTLASLMLVIVFFSSFVYISTFNDVSPLVSAYDVTFPVQTEQQLRDEVIAD